MADLVMVKVALDLPVHRLTEFRVAPLSRHLQTLRSLGASEDGDGVEDALGNAGLSMPDPTVDDLLAHLSQQAALGEQFMEVSMDAASGRIGLRGGLDSWHALNLYRAGLFEVAAAAFAAGARGHVSLLGELEGEIVLAWIDVDEQGLHYETPDPQNTPEPIWQERLGGVEGLEAAWQEWRRGHGG